MNDDDGQRRMLEALGLAAALVTALFILIYWLEWTS